MCTASQEGGQHDPAPGVLLTTLLAIKDLAQTGVLLHGPLGHLRQAHQSEDACGDALHRDGEAHPAVHLGRVVGAGDEVEQEAARDLVALLPRLAQVGQDDVAPQVAQLAHERDAQGHLALQLAGRGVLGVVDKVGHVGGEAPVVDAVAEQVEDGHGLMAELVHEEGFSDALAVVEGPVAQRQRLHQRVLLGRGLPRVQVLRQEVEQGVHNQGPKVLPEEHSGVANLGTQVLEMQNGATLQPIV
mmetsp:Transcript_28893/g.73762  ORF Transcript_28893/g.73762 Transcript_28893/m.73762 type:complete len:244 (+) Transcript_28893:255-986(+)